jgi:hypothetical protein
MVDPTTNVMNTSIKRIPAWGGLIICLFAAFTTSAQQVELVSSNFAGTGSGNNYSTIVASGAPVTALGRYVAFASRASDLIPNGPKGNFQNVYVRDLQSGTTTLASPDLSGTGGANADVYYFKISGNGRYLVFSSDASNLVADDTNLSPDLFVRDLEAGTTARVNTQVPAPIAFNDPDSFSISDDGRWIAFSTSGWNAGFPVDRNRLDDVYVWDRDTGTTRLVSVEQYGTRAGNDYSRLDQISGDGRYVLFYSYATNLTAEPDRNFGRDIFVRDLQTGATKLVTVSLNGTTSQGNNFTFGHGARISTDGRLVTFFAGGDDLAPNDHNGQADFFQRDMAAGTTKLVSVNSSGTNGGDHGVWNGFDVSPDGRFVAFPSLSTDLVPGEPAGDNCFVRDLKTGVTRIASRQVPFNQGADPYEISVSSDGRFVTFAVYQFVAGHYSSLLYMDDATADRTQQIGGTSPDNTVGSLDPVGFGSDGRFLVFYGPGTILPNDNNSESDVFVLWLDPAAIRRSY